MSTISRRMLRATFMAALLAALVGCATVPPTTGTIVMVTECFQSELEAEDRMTLGGQQIRDDLATAARTQILNLIDVESAVNGDLGVTCCRRWVDARKCGTTEQPFDVYFEVTDQLTAEQTETIERILKKHFLVK